MPFYLMHRRKTANGFFGEENVPGLPSALQAFSGLQGKDEDVPGAKEARLGLF